MKRLWPLLALLCGCSATAPQGGVPLSAAKFSAARTFTAPVRVFYLAWDPYPYTEENNTSNIVFNVYHTYSLNPINWSLLGVTNTTNFGPLNASAPAEFFRVTATNILTGNESP